MQQSAKTATEQPDQLQIVPPHYDGSSQLIHLNRLTANQCSRSAMNKRAQS